jgi:hypothetical protein
MSGRVDIGADEVKDFDNDGIPNQVENASDCLEYKDADSDDDGIPDGEEDLNQDGVVDAGETNPCDDDTDNDGIQDGTEAGVRLKDIGKDTDRSVFVPDADPSRTTDPLNPDSDGDGIPDGVEDANRNGRRDPGESDPTLKPFLPFVEPLLLEG